MFALMPPEFIALQQEVAQHPPLQKFLDSKAPIPIEEFFAEVAAYCGIILDDVYSPQDLINLCGVLHGRLFEKRSLLVVH